MAIPELSYEYIQSLDLEKAFDEYTDRYEESNNETYYKIRFGVIHKFDFYDWKIGLLEIEPKKGMFYHKSKRTYLKTEEMFTELEKRKRLIKQELYNMVSEDAVTNLREIE